jgi:hypothetical protein
MSGAEQGCNPSSHFMQQWRHKTNKTGNAKDLIELIQGDEELKL